MNIKKLEAKLERSVSVLEKTLSRIYRIGLWNIGAKMVINKYRSIEKIAVDAGINTLKYDKRVYDIITKTNCQQLITV